MAASTLRGDAVLVRRDGGVATLTLNRPHVYNALDRATLEELGRVVGDLSADPDVRSLVLTGAGRAFCSGADLSIDPAELDPGESRRMLAAADRAITAVVNAPVPVLAAVEGAAAGVGASLAFASDLVLATDSAYFLLPFTTIGLMPDGGATATVAAALGRARAMRLALRGERLGAREAYEAGLVAAVCPAGGLAALVSAWTSELGDKPREALRLTKEAINAATLDRLPDALAREARDQVGLLASSDFVDAVRSFRDRRHPATS